MTKKNKPYEMSETEPSMAAEPMAEYGLDINMLKFKTEQQRPPCQFTLEELKEQLRISEEDFENGRYITSEELAKQIETWR